MSYLLDIHQRRLRKLYEAAGGSTQKRLVLTEVLEDENLSLDEAWDEADYMKGEDWIRILADNGPPWVQLTHAGIKAAQSPLALAPTAGRGQITKQTLLEWAGTSRPSLALLFTDIVGSTALGVKFGDEKWIEILIRHFTRARHLLSQYSHYEIKIIGDSFMVAFHNPVDALNFAHSFYLDTGDPVIRIRAGIHVGGVRIIEEDIFGRMVNVTSRIVGWPEEDWIVLSNSAKEQVDAEWGAQLRRRSRRFAKYTPTLKGFSEPQIIWRYITSEMVEAAKLRAAPVDPPRRSRPPVT